MLLSVNYLIDKNYRKGKKKKVFLVQSNLRAVFLNLKNLSHSNKGYDMNGFILRHGDTGVVYGKMLRNYNVGIHGKNNSMSHGNKKICHCFPFLILCFLLAIKRVIVGR